MGKSDLDIARATRLRPIEEVAAGLGLGPEDLEPYGRHKAKIAWEAVRRVHGRADGALVLVTGITPTPAGEGKSTVIIGLADAFRRLGRRAIVAIREPSLGPCFGIKGVATGGGRAQVAPMEDINLHFTGDIHAVTAAHNLLAALLDNHLARGNGLGLDPRRIWWKRVLDVNDRALRSVVIGLGGPAHGVPRESGFEISAASELMAILCLGRDLGDVRARIARVIVGETSEGGLVTADDLRAAGAVTALLKDAIKPNLVQTLEGTPALIHGGPFGNIAHGCSSLVATAFGLKMADVLLTEAGFATELGAEKFFDIKCRVGGLVPAAAVLVATVRALKLHGGVPRRELARENVQAALGGMDNLAKHVENVRHFGVPVVVALNEFAEDTAAETAAVLDACRGLGVPARLSRVWAQGGAGGVEVAEAVLEAMAGRRGAGAFRYLYPDDLSLEKKIAVIAETLYGADGVDILPGAAARLAAYERLGHGSLPVCVAKTPSSLSDDPTRLGRPRGFRVLIRDARLAAGAGYVVAYAGDVLTMPGLPRTPAAEGVDVDADGVISGLF